MPQMKFNRESVYCEFSYPLSGAEMVILWSGAVLRRKRGEDFWEPLELSSDLATTAARAQWLGWCETFHAAEV